MNEFLPSRKVVAFVLVPVITIFSLWAITKYYATTVVLEKTGQSELEIALAEGDRTFQEQDTDGDGLKDWEEFLYQTDERNPDTDGDGSSDGLEVRRGFDPLAAGEGAVEDVDGQKTSGITFYKNDPNLTKTDLLARDIFVAYRDLKEGNALELDSLRSQAITDVIQDSTNIETKLAYTEQDLAIVSDSFTNKERYTRGYTAATRNLDPIQFDELSLLTLYIQNGDESALAELIKNKTQYELFAQELATLSVPQAVARVHLELINNVMIYADTIGNMALVDEDPVSSLAYSQKSIEDEELVVRNIEALSLYFSSN